MSIFQKSVLNSIKQDESLIASRCAEYQKYLAKVEAIKGFNEEVYQDGFFKDVFESCLGYTLKTTNPHDFNVEREIKLKKEIVTIENRVVECEKEIDAMVYTLYGLSEDEIGIVEGVA